MARADAGARQVSERNQEFSRYPNNALRQQVRDVSEVPSTQDLLREHFLKG